VFYVGHVDRVVSKKPFFHCNILSKHHHHQDLGTVTALPSKCVLLLGKEKEGIPVELLQEIDICLEIPQYGVIRSLNVHVSAALAIWEITKLNKQFVNDSKLNIV
jgi:tRNA G18 (ribose-2'-O)-methylase SpoU